MLVLLTLTELLLATPAWAQDADDGPEAPEPRPRPEEPPFAGAKVSLRALAETWDDPFLASRFTTGGMAANVAVMVPIWEGLAVEVEAGYLRVSEGGAVETAAEAEAGDTLSGPSLARFQMTPVSALVGWRLFHDDGPLEIVGQLGPTFVFWNESDQPLEYMASLPPRNADVRATYLAGVRPTFEVRLGVSIDLGLIGPAPLAPALGPTVAAIELELLFARRFAPTEAGFDFNGWRGGVGLAARF